ncbi:MAG: hypothetical protein GYA43_00085, partial [Bacteroidales bacterium]|nr:hypothetical protein [Bacteroidales bacterium]
LTWVLFGIWHGAGWTFMLLGVLQGLAIIFEFYTKKWRTRLFSGMPGTVRKWTGRILTYLFYCLTLVFFFSPDLTSVVTFFSKLGEIKGSLSDMIRPDILIMTILFIGLFMIFEILKNDHNTLYSTLERSIFNSRIPGRVFRWTFYFGMMAVIFVLSNNVQQFIYFQF